MADHITDVTGLSSEAVVKLPLLQAVVVYE